jgi:mannan endo-1,4-beta-mannosidase
VPECEETMPAWINEMASFMKELDPNHLVTSGGEGFWGADNKRAEHNPQMPASRSGSVGAAVPACKLSYNMLRT